MIVVVADTSVYVSALVFGGLPQVAVAEAMRPPYRLAVSAALRCERSLPRPSKTSSAGHPVEWLRPPGACGQTPGGSSRPL